MGRWIMGRDGRIAWRTGILAGIAVALFVILRGSATPYGIGVGLGTGFPVFVATALVVRLLLFVLNSGRPKTFEQEKGAPQSADMVWPSRDD